MYLPGPAFQRRPLLETSTTRSPGRYTLLRSRPSRQIHRFQALLASTNPAGLTAKARPEARPETRAANQRDVGSGLPRRLGGLRANVGFGYSVQLAVGFEDYLESGPHRAWSAAIRMLPTTPGPALTSYDRVHRSRSPVGLIP